MVCEIKYKDKTYSYENWIAKLNDGLIDEFIAQGKISINVKGGGKAISFEDAVHSASQIELSLNLISNNDIVSKSSEPRKIQIVQERVKRRLDVLNKLVNCR